MMSVKKSTIIMPQMLVFRDIISPLMPGLGVLEATTGQKSEGV